MRNKTLGEIIRDARIKSGMSQRKLAEISGISRPLINLLEAGKRMNTSINTVTSLANALHIPAQEIMGIEHREFRMGEMVGSRIQTVLADIAREARERYDALDLVELPVHGTVPAGIPFPAEQEQGEFIEVPRRELNSIAPQGLYALKVGGDSLRGDEIYSGDLIIVNPGDTAILDGKIYIVRLGNEVCARHIFKQDGYLKLVSSDNISNEIKADEVEVLGRVILSGRWKRH